MYLIDKCIDERNFLPGYYLPTLVLDLLDFLMLQKNGLLFLEKTLGYFETLPLTKLLLITFILSLS